MGMPTTATRSLNWVVALLQSITDGSVVVPSMLVGWLLEVRMAGSKWLFSFADWTNFFILLDSKRLGALKSTLHSNSKPPWGKSDEYCLGAFMMHMIDPPLLIKTGHRGDIGPGTCPTIMLLSSISCLIATASGLYIGPSQICSKICPKWFQEFPKISPIMLLSVLIMLALCSLVANNS